MAIDRIDDMESDQTVAGLTLLAPSDRQQPDHMVDPFAGTEALDHSDPASLRMVATPLSVPKWVWIIPTLSVKCMFLAYLAGAPFPIMGFFGIADVVLIALLIFLVYLATGAGQGVAAWLAHDPAHKRRATKKR